MRTWSLSHLSLWGKVITLIDYNNTIKQKMHVYVTATNSVYLQHSDGQRCISHRTEILVDFFVDRSGHTCTCLMGKPCNRGVWVWGGGGRNDWRERELKGSLEYKTEMERDCNHVGWGAYRCPEVYNSDEVCWWITEIEIKHWNY